MHAVAGRGAGHGVEAGQGSSIEFQGVETGIDRDGRVLEVVAELRAFVGERGDIAPRSSLAEAVNAQTQSAPLAADKPSVLEIVARGKVAASGGAAAEGQKVAVRVRALVRSRVAAKAGLPT